jgi:signal transduction histidine kinase
VAPQEGLKASVGSQGLISVRIPVDLAREAWKDPLPRDTTTFGRTGGASAVLTRRPPALRADASSHAAQLQEKNRRRDEALSTAAHELKTPLGIITGYIDLLLSEKPGPLSERQRRVLEESRLSCTRLQQFVQSFLTFSALETGNITLSLQRGDLNQCLLEICDFWLPQFEKKPLAFHFLPSAHLQEFDFDYHKVQHIVSNLLENALKFTPAGGTVWLTTGPHMWERRGQQEPGVRQERRKRSVDAVNSARVTVADTGPGVDPEYQQEIFDDFFRPPHEGVKGTGLGLAIARRLVQAHSGKLWVESVPDSGARFSFLLPFKPL